MISLLDTGFLYGLIDKVDAHHPAVVAAMRAYRGRILLPVPAITELGFLISSNLGPQAMVRFLESMGDFGFELVTSETIDYFHSAEIFRKYNDNNIDFVDACIVAMAERMNITKILTVDRRHFSTFRPKLCESFEILP